MDFLTPNVWLDLVAVLDEHETLVQVQLTADHVEARDPYHTTRELQPIAKHDLDTLIDFLDQRSLEDAGPRHNSPVTRRAGPALTYHVLCPPMSHERILTIRRWPAATSWATSIPNAKAI